MSRSRRLALGPPGFVALALAIAAGVADAQLKRAYGSYEFTLK